MDAFCVGEPWNEQLVNQGIGFGGHYGALWKGHPVSARCAPTGLEKIQTQ
jgi:nitrate/nitrite transport system substrate-binding protein